MKLKKEHQDGIITAITSLQNEGATITKIESKVPFERHTLSKYLSMMQIEGLIFYRTVGKAKLWHVDKAPLKTVLNNSPEKRNFAEQVLSNIIENLPIGLIVTDKDYTIQFMNEQMIKKYGKKEGEKLYHVLYGIDSAVKLKKISRLIELETASTALETEDQNGRVLSISASRIESPDKSVSVLLNLEDITERKKSEQELIEHKNLLESERTALNEAVVVAETDTEGNITYVNKMFEKLSGYSKEELIGQNHRLLNSGYHPKEYFKELWNTIKKGQVWKGQIINKSKDGKLYWTESVITPVKNKQGNVVKYVAVRFDVSKYLRK